MPLCYNHNCSTIVETSTVITLFRVHMDFPQIDAIWQITRGDLTRGFATCGFGIWTPRVCKHPYYFI
jgi:hypothetical protein